MTQEELLRLIDQAAAEGWTELDLSRKKLRELPPEIGQLSNLRSLNLSGNQLSALPAEIGQLTRLQELNLSYNQLSALPAEIGQLASLSSLDLSGNQLSALSAEIFQLNNLQRLDLYRNRLSTLPAEISQLNSLQRLDLKLNQLSALPPKIGELSNLQLLDLSLNQLSELPAEIGQLSKLQLLYLFNNQLNVLPPKIGELSNLQLLDLSSNQLSVLPPKVGELSNLKELCLSKNQLSELPAGIIQLTSLQELYLDENQLSRLPAGIVQLKRLEKLDLRGNPVPIPPAILGPKELQKYPGDVKAILDFYFQTLDPKETAAFYEAKFLIVGEPEAGKTTLAQKLQDETFELTPNQGSTRGIDVMRWQFTQPNGQTFIVNIWDFGGQDIYHNTHQFFLTERSLYALVADTRRTNPDLYYWFNTIQLLGGNSPVLLVKNEKQDRQCDIQEGQLRSEFENLKESLPTNLSTNRGLPKIKAAIQRYITQLPHVDIPLPKLWVRVRAALENDRRNYIDERDFCALCRANSLTDSTEMWRLSQYLHDLGICLHFQKDSLLKRWVILKPEWATNAVYKVTDDEQVQKDLGRFTLEDLNKIWSEGEYANMHDELLQLMKRFKLCYEIPGLENTYIAPELLQKEPPCYDWDASQNLLLRYKYEFMPKGILTRFIVEMHKFIDQQRLVWKSGVVLNNGPARAEVIEQYHKGEIQIRVSGNRKKDILTVVAHEIDKINDSYERIRVKKLIPCNCPTCEGNQEPQFYPLQVLDKFLNNRKYEIQCQNGFTMVDIRKLIFDVTDSGYGQDFEERDPHGLDTTVGPDLPKDRATKRNSEKIEQKVETWTVQKMSSNSHNSADSSPCNRSIFLSYAWRTESEEVASQIDKAFQAKGITIVRDKRDLGFKGLIKEFMEEIGRGKCVIAVIDDKYLKSPNCMFELVKVAECGDFHDRIFPVVLESAKIYKGTDRLKYIRHWQNEIDALNTELQDFGYSMKVSSIQEELNQYEDIRNTIDGLTGILKNMNTLTVEMHQESEFEEIIRAVEERLNEYPPNEKLILALLN